MNPYESPKAPAETHKRPPKNLCPICYAEITLTVALIVFTYFLLIAGMIAVVWNPSGYPLYSQIAAGALICSGCTAVIYVLTSYLRNYPGHE